ncbi:hypothetical protein L1787_18115 [Acuticoccus sp. M5D2P5]|uniref:hypothetical protein n=1 Tax=Acuticoccus kalidii TaxID=2910977 RepID=UPI001F2E47BC|nr:hypothetical protein [Acuticoccus kalidii]MCF3935313.1 hypothetical protein [Acuticoccus kalidii]
MRGGVRAGAGRPETLNDWLIIQIGGACEARLREKSEPRIEECAQRLRQKIAKADYRRRVTLSNSADSAYEDDASDRSVDRLSDDDIHDEYEQHFQVPPELVHMANRDVARLVREGRIKEADRAKHEALAQRQMLTAFRRDVIRAANGEEPVVPDALKQALEDAAYALNNRGGMFEGKSQITTLPKGTAVAIGRNIRIIERRSKVASGDSLRKQVIQEIAAESEELFGAPYTKYIVGKAWKEYPSLLQEIRPEEIV